MKHISEVYSNHLDLECPVRLTACPTLQRVRLLYMQKCKSIAAKKREDDLRVWLQPPVLSTILE